MLETNADRVKRYIEQFAQYGKPFYIITDGRGTNILDRNDGANAEESLEDAADKLERTLLRICRDNDRCKVTVKVFDELPRNKKFTAKSEADISISCTFKPDILPDGFTERQGAYQQIMANNANNEIMRRLDELQTRIEVLTAEEEEEIEEEAQPATFGSIIAGMIQNNPQIQNLMINILANTLTGTVMKQQTTNLPQNLAGTETTEDATATRLTVALEKLFSKGVNVEHIEKLAEMPAIKIKTLLTML